MVSLPFLRRFALIAGLVVGQFYAGAVCAGETMTLADDKLVLEVVADKLHFPWGMVFLPDGRMLVTERIGRIRILDKNGRIVATPAGVPEVHGDLGGLLDVALDPHFEQNSTIYFTYGERKGRKSSTTVAKARLSDVRLLDFKVLFRQLPKERAIWHFGSRIVFAKDGTFYVTLGDNREQIRKTLNLDNYLGKVLRLNPDGSAASGNPYLKSEGVKPEIWSIGHRNPQGAALHPQTGELWMSEHGPLGGDEINVSLAGRNYGWPKASYGSHYSHVPIPDSHALFGFEEPVHHWKDAVAPAGITFYTGKQFPKWQGNLLVATLRGQRLIRLTLKGHKVIGEEHLLAGLDKRLRHVVQGPDGYIYVLTDEEEGQIIRIKPLR